MPHFQQLENDIYKATKVAFRALMARSHPEPICAFALYTDESALTVCPAANTPTHLANCQKANPGFVLDYKFSPAEWAYEGEGADNSFNAICSQLSARLNEVASDELVVESYRDELLASCFGVLRRLKAEGFFESITGGPILLLLAVSDAAISARDVAFVRALNDTATGDTYEQWVRTFTEL